VEVSIILDAGPDIKKTLRDLRESVDWLKYEFIVTDRGTKHRKWLAQQGDVQVIFVNDDRETGELPELMARYVHILTLENGGWAHQEIEKPVSAVKEELRTEVLRSVSQIAERLGPKQKPRPPALSTDRILHISSFYANTVGITSALREFGEVKCFNWQTHVAESGAEAMNQALLATIREFRPGTIFMEECFTGDVRPETLRRAKRENHIGIINWCGDMREGIPPSMVAMGSAVDWTLISNRRQARDLLARGIQAAFLPAGCPTEIYKRMEPDHDAFPEDIIFLGSGGRKFPNSQLRLDVIQALHKKYRDRFGVYGRGWRKRSFPWVKPFIEPCEREAVAYSSCKIAIGISAFTAEGYTSARMWKAMGSGACYLPHYFPGIERWFKPQQEVAWWRTPKELISHIEYYLRRHDERQRMADAGMHEVRNNHSWEQRMQTALRILSGGKIKGNHGTHL